MPITYAERKKRRQALLQQLPPELRQQLALRNVEAVVKLPEEAQQTLAEALNAGLRHVPEAIAYLKGQPGASVEELRRACRDELRREPDASVPDAGSPGSKETTDPSTKVELAALLQTCFPGMPALTARALAADDLFCEVLAMMGAQQACLHSKPIHSELVFVALCGLALGFIDELNQLMTSRPHYRGALLKSGLYAQRAAYSRDIQDIFWPFDAWPVSE